MVGGGLWRSPDFLKLWGGQSISELGTAITALALPLLAISVLHASPFEVGLLGALQALSYPLLGAVAGVWVDRLPRRPIMIVCDAARMLVLGSIPFSYFILHTLSMPQLYVAALLLGAFTVFFDIAYQSYLPSLVGRADLVEGNSKLLGTKSVAEVAGPAVAGALINLLRAPMAILADAGTYLISVLTLLWIRKPEPRPERAEAGRSGFFRELWAGARIVFGHTTIRLLTAANATGNLGASAIEAVFLLYAYNQLHLSAATIGGLYAAAAAAAAVGAAIGPRIAQRLGMGPVMTVTAVLYRAPYLVLPLIAIVGAPILVLGVVLVTSRFGELTYQVTQLSLRQGLVPDRLQGRVSAFTRTVAWGAIPVGSTLGGALGANIGLVPTIMIGALLSVLAAGWLLAGPVRIREQPSVDPEAIDQEQPRQLPAPEPRRKLDVDT
jgi:MFS family permease